MDASAGNYVVMVIAIHDQPMTIPRQSLCDQD